MMSLLYVFLGGGLGALCRYWIGLALGGGGDQSFPWHTLLSNFVACFIAGAAMAWLPRSGFYSEGRLWLLTGFCGGFSTFSTFGLEVMAMIQRGHWTQAVMYILISLCATGLGVFSGWKIFNG